MYIRGGLSGGRQGGVPEVSVNPSWRSSVTMRTFFGSSDSTQCDLNMLYMTYESVFFLFSREQMFWDPDYVIAEVIFRFGKCNKQDNV